VYLASVKAAQQELDAAAADRAMVSPGSSDTAAAASSAPALNWPGLSTGISKLASMKAATQAALAAVGLDSSNKSSSSSSVAFAVDPAARVSVKDGAPEDSPVFEAQTGSVDPAPSVEAAAAAEVAAAAAETATAGPESFDLGLMHSWASAIAVDTAADRDGAVSVEASTGPAAQHSSSADDKPTVTGPDDVVVAVVGGSLYDLD
jgi:hypothetical protein